jgi:RNA polymerase-binding transcription factor DksA
VDKLNFDQYKSILSKKEKEIKHTIELMKENKSAEQDKYSPTELSNYDNHPAEIGTLLYEVEHNNAIRVHEEYLLRQIEDALARIDKGTYGICTFCGTEIDEERLLALPYVNSCIECEEDRSANASILRVKPPYIEQELRIKKHLNEWDDTEFEGLDQWNDLVKYGSSDTPQDMGKNRDLKEFYTNEIDNQGIVDDMDRISNEEYRKQLPD